MTSFGGAGSIEGKCIYQGLLQNFTVDLFRFNRVDIQLLWPPALLRSLFSVHPSCRFAVSSAKGGQSSRGCRFLHARRDFHGTAHLPGHIA